MTAFRPRIYGNALRYRYALRYRPGTERARRNPGPAAGRFGTREVAERVRSACPHAEDIEVVWIGHDEEEAP